MNFFQAQEAARKTSTRLFWLFALGVAVVVLAVVVLVYFAYQASAHKVAGVSPVVPHEILWLAALITASAISLRSMWEIHSLARSVGGVASAVGGHPVFSSTQNPLEKKLLNIVEEMAIAAGIAMPQVYILHHESNINAFAAAYEPNNAVVAVSMGALRQLNRDELQGVIGHEISHILNGDGRINIRIMGLSVGLQMVSLLGSHLLNAGGRSRNSKDNTPLLILGLGLSVIGVIGSIGAKFLHAATSRQREYLADASAVQFTRNPDGIGGALRKIAGSSAILHVAESERVSFMCLEAASKNWLSGFLATHPPLSERIFAIYGQDLSPIIPSDLYTDNPTEKPTLSTPFAPHVNTPLVSTLATQTPDHAPTGTAPQSQTPTLEALANAIAQQIPSDLRAVLHTPLGAMQMMYAVMLMADQGDHAAALTSLAAYLPPAEIAQVSQYYQRIANMVEIDRIMWLELAMPTIRAQSPEVKKTFYTALCTVASSNQTLTLTEQLLIILTRQRLSPHYGQAVSQNLSLSQAGTALNQIASSLLAETAYADHAQALTAAGAALQRYGMGITPSPSKMPLSTLAEAFDQINHLKPMAKSAVLDTLMALIHADGHVSSNEREFIRALCIAMQIPMAPNLHPSVA